MLCQQRIEVIEAYWVTIWRKQKQHDKEKVRKKSIENR